MRLLSNPAWMRCAARLVLEVVQKPKPQRVIVDVKVILLDERVLHAVNVQPVLATDDRGP